MSTRNDPRLRNSVLLNVKQVAELIGIHHRTVWRLAATGDIPSPIRISAGVVRWRLRDIEQFLNKTRRG